MTTVTTEDRIFEARLEGKRQGQLEERERIRKLVQERLALNTASRKIAIDDLDLKKTEEWWALMEEDEWFLKILEARP